jgi:hypothetical protein
VFGSPKEPAADQPHCPYKNGILTVYRKMSDHFSDECFASSVYFFVAGFLGFLGKKSPLSNQFRARSIH